MAEDLQLGCSAGLWWIGIQGKFGRYLYTIGMPQYLSRGTPTKNITNSLSLLGA